MAGGMITRGKGMQRAKQQDQAKAHVQAQAVKVPEVTRNDSLELIRCLLKVSVNEICFLRGLFAEDCFNGINLQHLEGMHLQSLKSADPQAQRLMRWLDEGIQDAVEKMYLKTMFFGMAADADGTRLLEEYMFSFSYNQDGKVTLEVGDNKNGCSAASPFKSADMESIRFQVCRLIRTLVQICRTLDKVPEKRFLFIKLTYHDCTPPDYEPPYFKSDQSQSYFLRKPFHMHVGGIATAYHAVGLRVKSMLDSADYGDEEVPMSEGHSSCPPSSATGGTNWQETSKSRPKPAFQNDHSSEHRELQPHSPVAPTLHVTALSDITCDKEADQEFCKIKAFCQRRKKVDLADVMAHFATVQASQLKRHMEQLANVLQKPSTAAQDSFIVYQTDAVGATAVQLKAVETAQSEMVPTSHAPAICKQVVQEMSDQSDLARATKALQALKASDPNAPRPAAKASGVMCPGSENTYSRPPKLHTGPESAAMDEASQQPIAEIFFDSQQSGRNKRKASVVDELICQSKKAKRTTSRGRLTNMSQ